MINSIGYAPRADASSGAGSSSSSTTDSLASATSNLANENTFLKLLVSQLQNQDPENPQDGTQFVAQLAQFSSLEQELGMKQDLDTIKQAVTSTGTGTNSSSSSGSSGTTNS